MMRSAPAKAMMGALLMMAPMNAAPAQDAQPGVVFQPGAVLQPPAVYRFMIGDAVVTALSDGTVPINLHALLIGATPAKIDDLLGRSFMTNPVQASIAAFLIEMDGRKILVDTGAGTLFGPGNAGRLPEALAIAGVTADQISDILITHVHADHCGGLVRDGKMMFPHAIIHVGKPDLDFFLDKTNSARTGYGIHFFDEGTAMLKPYLDAGKVQAFAHAGEILPGISAELRPGHTPGSAFYTLGSRGQRLVFIGDIIHIGAVQFPDPQVTIRFDQNQAKARIVREQAFSEFARARTLIAAPHLNFPGIGHIVRDGTAYRWVPVEYANHVAQDKVLDVK